MRDQTQVTDHGCAAPATPGSYFAHRDEPHVVTAVTRYERFRCAGMCSVDARSDH